LIIDLHIHTTPGSPDSLIRPRELVQMAKRVGLDGVCITEHGNRKAEGIEELAREYNFLVLGGFEATTELGDILVFGVDSYPRDISRAAELRRFVAEAGGVMIAAHPFRNYITRRAYRLPGDSLTIEKACSLEIFRLVDAIEVVNGWSIEEDTIFTQEVSSRLAIKGTGGSDAHLPTQIGCCVTIFENTIRTERDLVAELKGGRFQAADRRKMAQRNPAHWFSSNENRPDI
jgi:predicted metal-dependent phosphoesterase TrpH